MKETGLQVVQGGNGMAPSQHGAMAMSHLVPQTIAEAATLARAFFQARMFKVQSEEQALTILLTGMELGLAPATAMRGISVIDGKPSLSADLMVGVVRCKPNICEIFDVLESTDAIATCRTRRVGSQQVVTMSFTWEDAQRAGLTNKDNYKKYPAQMLLARCKARLSRAVYEDLVMGLYTPDELTSGAIGDPEREIADEYAASQPAVNVTQQQPKAQAQQEARDPKWTAARKKLVDVLSDHPDKAAWRAELDARGAGPKLAGTFQIADFEKAIADIKAGLRPWEAPVDNVIDAEVRDEQPATFSETVRAKAGVAVDPRVPELQSRIQSLSMQVWVNPPTRGMHLQQFTQAHFGIEDVTACNDLDTLTRVSQALEGRRKAAEAKDNDLTMTPPSGDDLDDPFAE